MWLFGPKNVGYMIPSAWKSMCNDWVSVATRIQILIRITAMACIMLVFRSNDPSGLMTYLKSCERKPLCAQGSNCVRTCIAQNELR